MSIPYKKLFSKLKNTFNERRIKRIFSDSQSTKYYDSEILFNDLMMKYPKIPDYRYDAYSAWLRGTQRAQQIFENIENIRVPSLDILEAGCGDAMTGAVFEHFGHKVTLVDIEDWRDIRARKINFVCADICSNLPLESNSVDLICSFNTFEHLENPETALKELIRICKPGGHIYLEFGPLYYSPFGLHACRLRMPYPQLLFSANYIKKKIAEIGVYDLGREMRQLQPLNKWTVSEYEKLVKVSTCEIINFIKYYDTKFLQVIMDFPDAFKGRGLTFDDISVYALRIILRKL